ncbi:MAG: cation-translocating P-type ATPase [Syntrophobacterales bacterium]|nr:cation-translocating P-type ATPase [Syntrophobacterales bacterium]
MSILETAAAGLSASQAMERLEQYGPNELTPPKKISPWTIFFRQFQNLLIIILIAATGISFFLGEHLDAYVILVIILACTILGFVQEYRAEQAAAALQKLAAPEAAVLRDGREQVIPAREVVPGDVLVLHTGDRCAADGRVLEAVNLKNDESLLTGESTSVNKTAAPDSRPNLPVADQKGMVFGGTVVTYGRGRAVVTATGMDTEFGGIARMLGEVVQEKTPLEERMASIGLVLSILCLSVSAGAMVFGILKGNNWLQMLIWGISLAVAAVPEALPAVVTGALAIGTTRMARRNAIVKRLPAVETMGCTTVICTDKTGTLTRNEMTVRRLFLDNREFEVSGLGYEPEGDFFIEGSVITPGDDPVLMEAARIAMLCNDAVLTETVEGAWTIQGDPTEGALVVLGRKAGLHEAVLARECPRVAEIPFDSERKRMTTFHCPSTVVACTKGAPEGLLPRCRNFLSTFGERPLTEGNRQVIMNEAAHMAGEALRVLGLAYRKMESIPEAPSEEMEADLIWVGLVGMMDPPRSEAKEAVSKCHQAGIRVIMVTGDHPDTARAVAREIGLTPADQANPVVLSGVDLNRLSDEELSRILPQAPVFARVAPEHKLRLVNLLKAQGDVVAMTGDGVNDAPALKRADIGVAMGITGTEVTKETADMILADDNFATLVAAVEEGRAIFDNIKKYLIFLLSANLGEITVLTGTFFLGMPLPLVALQILWVNLTTDGLPALALGVDPKAPDIMHRPPRPPEEGVFTRSVIALMVVITAYLTVGLIPLFHHYYHGYLAVIGDPELSLTRAQTMVFVTLVLAELVNAFNCRSEYHSIFRVGVLANRFLLLATLISLGMVVAVVQVPPLAQLFHAAPLGWKEWLFASFLAFLLLPVVEVTKWLMRLGARRMAVSS